MALKAVQYNPLYCAEAKADAEKNGFRPWRWDTSHDLTIIDSNGDLHRIGTFKHALWAAAVGKMIEHEGLPGIDKKEGDG